MAEERAFSVTPNKTIIPVTLDFEKHNYDTWRGLFTNYCTAYDTLLHIEYTAVPTGDRSPSMAKTGCSSQNWIYTTISELVLNMSFSTTGTARDVWTRIEAHCCTNKEARVRQLDVAIKEYERIKENNWCEVERLDKERRADFLNMMKGFVVNQVGYAEKVANVWTKVAEETSQYDRESS